MSQPFASHLDGGWRKTNFQPNDLDKKETVKTNEKYKMPIGLMNMHIFERLKNCQNKVFCSEKSSCFDLKILIPPQYFSSGKCEI